MLKKEMNVKGMKQKVWMMLCLCMMSVLAFGCGQKNQEDSSQETVMNEQGSVIEVLDGTFKIKKDDGDICEFARNEDTVDVTNNGVAVGEYVSVVCINENSQLLATDISYAERVAQGVIIKTGQEKFTIQTEDENAEEIVFCHDDNTTINLENYILEKGYEVLVNYKTTIDGNYATTVNECASDEDTQESAEE